MNAYLSKKLSIISFISIVLVVLIHSQFLTKEMVMFNKVVQCFFSYGITSPAVPLFFCISGYLFFLNSQNIFKEYFVKLKKRCKTILIPYIIASIYGAIVIALLLHIPFTKTFFSQQNQSIFQGSILKVLYTIFNNPLVYQLWFLRDLFLLFILSPIIYLLLKYTRWVYLAILAVIWLEIFNWQPTLLDNKSIFFFSLGAFLAIYHQNLLLKQFHNQWLYIVIIGWFCAITLESMLNAYNLIERQNANILLKINTLWGGIPYGAAMIYFWTKKKCYLKI